MKPGDKILVLTAKTNAAPIITEHEVAIVSDYRFTLKNKEGVFTFVKDFYVIGVNKFGDMAFEDAHKYHEMLESGQLYRELVMKNIDKFTLDQLRRLKAIHDEV
jgi:hypothetical protein